ncbi:hypothetical protein OIE66_40620 [Nonomuraea sp. NBC_01738]|uniref:hypothetical protein n=1 Tax=Nonomuraea sp. NBC_01738 TaxID=2976003 RepID=UPI002E13769D|nr:hypothetical protein OIE66_40620 [Nonomuraea sp. NBC_01738]
MVHLDGPAVIHLTLIAAALAILAAVIGSAMRSDQPKARARRAARRHPSARRLAKGLDYPVYMPPRHPEHYTTGPDSTDVQLAELHDELWPAEEYLAVLDCPTPHRTAYPTAAAAHAARPGATTYLCLCGMVHARPRRRLRSRRLARRRT